MDIYDKLVEIRHNIVEENIEIQKQFDEIINNLILVTPSGDLRNQLTDLNILFNKFVDNSKELI